jgi:hypothetical protein
MMAFQQPPHEGATAGVPGNAPQDGQVTLFGLLVSRKGAKNKE